MASGVGGAGGGVRGVAGARESGAQDGGRAAVYVSLLEWDQAFGVGYGQEFE